MSEPQSVPSVAGSSVDFDRDIRPIFQTSCLRCHGPEKPKSHFRLDLRDAALAGGDDNTNDLVPGNSVGSQLTHYIAREVPDLEMPPVDKGDPLTPQQVSLIRAWIDQGADWGLTNQYPSLGFSFTPALRWTDVHGDLAKYRELEGVKAGAGGGVQEFSLREQINPNETLSMAGHVLMPDRDIRLHLAREETDLGFVHAGVEVWRKYYADSGGFDPQVAPPELSLNRDLWVDNGRTWIDFGLTLPHWPQIVAGYEYQFKNGTKSMLDWGQVPGENVNLAPATKTIDEQTHIIRLNLAQELAGWQLANEAQVEIYSEKNRSDEANLPGVFLGGAPVTQDQYHQVQGMDTFTAEKRVRDWWFLSGGGYYSRLSGGDVFSQTNGAFGYAGSSAEITLRRESEIFSVASIFTPLAGWSLSLGSQNEWSREEGFGNDIPDFEFSSTNNVFSNLERFQSRENAALRFTQIPFTVVFADARLEQETVTETQAEGQGALARRTAARNDREDLRAGLNTSPWQWSALNVEYRRQASVTDYQPLQDDFGLGLGPPTNGYPAFLLGRKIQSDEFETKLVLHPARWLKTTLTYQLSTTDYRTTTDPAIDLGSFAPVSPGGMILAGTAEAQTYGWSATVTPCRQLYLSETFTCNHARVATAGNGNLSVTPYQGNVYTIATTATYAFNSRTDLQATYDYSCARYDQANRSNGAGGINFSRHEVLAGVTRRITPRLSGSIHYSFSQYAEASSGSLNHFTANGIFATFAYQWP